MKQETPMHIAAENGCLDICELILKNPDVKDKNPRLGNNWVRDLKGETPLHLAATEGHATLVEVLLRTGAEVDSKDMVSTFYYSSL